MTALSRARTFLFVPGDRSERFAKAARSGAHAVIIDLEDAVAPAAKTSARTSAVEWLVGGGEAVVRINSTADDAERDLALLAGAPRPFAVMLPKAERGEQVVAIRATLGAVAVIPLIETARGIAGVRELGRTVGVERLAIGSLDLALDLSIDEGSNSMASARWEIVLASRLAGLPAPIDTVTPEIADGSPAGVAAAVARANGFGGKLCIHPAQVAPVNAAFQPTQAELEWASRVLEAAGAGAVSRVDGAMVDRPVIERAQRIRAEAALLSR